MTVQAKAFPDLVVVNVDAAPESKPEPGLTRKVISTAPHAKFHATPGD
jgi:hypothetical protein